MALQSWGIYDNGANEKVHLKFVYLFVCLMVCNATFTNISVISWQSVLLVEETGGPGESHRPVAKSLTNFITLCCTPRPDRDSNSQHQ